MHTIKEYRIRGCLPVFEPKKALAGSVTYYKQNIIIATLLYIERTIQKAVFVFMTFGTSGIAFCENQACYECLQNTICYPGENH